MISLTKTQASNLLILLNLIAGYSQNDEIPAFEFVEDRSIKLEAECDEDDVVIKICAELDEDELVDNGFEFEVEDSYYFIAV